MSLDDSLQRVYFEFRQFSFILKMHYLVLHIAVLVE